MSAHAIAFDTLAYSKKLKEVGVPEAQAEVQAEALRDIIDDKLATKRDIALLQRDIELLRKDVRKDMHEMEMRLKMWFGTMLAGVVVFLAGLMTLLSFLTHTH